jgi:membrane associated rhomboid family serine protease
MVRYSCSGCGAGVDLPLPALPGQSVACPNCRRDMTPPGAAPHAQPPQAGGPAGRMTWSVRRQTHVLVGIVVLLWVLGILDLFLPGHDWFDRCGIQPRYVPSLVNIFLAPFVHDGFAHLIANTLVLVPLAWLVMLRGPRDFLLVSLVAMVVSGLGIWLTGPLGSRTVGASGVVFGYLGFLLVIGYLERSCLSFLFAVGVGVFFGSMLWGVLPSRREVSWQGHLFGFVGGALAAWLLAPRGPAWRAPAGRG